MAAVRDSETTFLWHSHGGATVLTVYNIHDHRLLLLLLSSNAGDLFYLSMKGRMMMMMMMMMKHRFV